MVPPCHESSSAIRVCTCTVASQLNGLGEVSEGFVKGAFGQERYAANRVRRSGLWIKGYCPLAAGDCGIIVTQPQSSGTQVRLCNGIRRIKFNCAGPELDSLVDVLLQSGGEACIDQKAGFSPIAECKW